MARVAGHGGMPNTSTEIRTMLAMVHVSAAHRGVDESGFRGFAAERGSEDFWQHPREPKSGRPPPNAHTSSQG